MTYPPNLIDCRESHVLRSPPRWVPYVLITIIIGALPGCSLGHWAHNRLRVGPNYCRPAAQVANDWLDSADPRTDSALPEFVDWWSVFNDLTLNELIEIARSQNLTLREAGWRIQQARDLRRQVAGLLLPQGQLVEGNYTRLLNSRDTAIPLPLHTFDNWSVAGALAWELDVWGRFRRAVAAADATVEVVEGDYDFILLSLIADVAEAYNQYRIFEQRLQKVRANIVIQEGSLNLAQIRADEGKTGYAAVSLAKSNLAASRALEPLFESGLRQTNNAICILLGIPTEDLTAMLGDGKIPTAPPEVAIGIPADLLRRRPDIRAAERSVAAQSEQIGIALADLYPAFSISGTIGWAAEDFSDLLKSSSNTGTVGPSFRWNVLNYGRIMANVDQQKSGLQALIAKYKNTVLNANKEVEDALIEFLKNQERVQFLEDAVAETEEALRLIMIAYEEGEIDFTPVFVLQDVLVANQDSLVVAHGDVAFSLVALYKALGGGWQVRCPNASLRGVDPSTLDYDQHHARPSESTQPSQNSGKIDDAPSTGSPSTSSSSDAQVDSTPFADDSGSIRQPQDRKRVKPAKLPDDLKRIDALEFPPPDDDEWFPNLAP